MKKRPRKNWTIEEKKQVLAEVAARRGLETIKTTLDRLGVGGSMYVRWAKQMGKGEATEAPALPPASAFKPTAKNAHKSDAFRESVAHAYHTRAPGETLAIVSTRFQVAPGSVHRWSRQFPPAGRAPNGAITRPSIEEAQAELPLENPFRSAPPGEAAPREQKQIVVLKAKIEFLEDQLTMLRGMVKIAIKRGLLEL